MLNQLRPILLVPEEQSPRSLFAGTIARLVFAAVLFVYFNNAAFTKVGPGLEGFFSLEDKAYAQILPSLMLNLEYDVSAVPFLPYGLLVHFAVYAEFILPVLIILGLFTRAAALGMAIFVIVQTYVDIFHHDLADDLGQLFDRIPGDPFLDQRALWIALLVTLFSCGPGILSLDRAWGIEGSGKKSLHRQNDALQQPT